MLCVRFDNGLFTKVKDLEPLLSDTNTWYSESSLKSAEQEKRYGPSKSASVYEVSEQYSARVSERDQD